MVNRMRTTRSKSGSRRSHHALTAPTLVACKHCDAHHRPHHMCLECGFYNGRQVIDLAKKKQEREARMQAKRERIRAEAESIASSEAEAVAEAQPAETSEEKK